MCSVLIWKQSAVLKNSNTVEGSMSALQSNLAGKAESYWAFLC